MVWSNTGGLLDLPDEVLEGLAAHLSQDEALQSLSLACTRLRRLVCHQVTALTLRSNRLDWRYFPAVRALELRFVEREGFDWLLPVCAQLQSLVIGTTQVGSIRVYVG